MSLATTVDLFVTDPSFINHATPYHATLTNGGVGRLDDRGLSYFLDMYTDKDDRDPTTRVVDWTPVYAPFIMVDNAYYSDFITDLSAANQSVRDAVYAILDRTLFDHSATSDIETDLTTNAATKAVYVPQSLTLATSSVTDTVYSTTSNTPTPFTGPPYVTFTVTIPKGSTSVEYAITAYSDNATWLKLYPNTTIIAIAPPTDYNTLLNSPLTTAVANAFATATATVNLNYTSLFPSLDTKSCSGYLLYKVVVQDTVNNASVSAPFTILYKGSQPSQLQIRVAVKNAVVSSGYGTEDQWKARIPDLFVDKQFILVPMYDATTAESDSTIYPNIISPKTVITKMGKIFPSIDSATLLASTEVLLASYEKVWIAAIEDTDSDNTEDGGVSTPTTLLQLFPTYQIYATTDPNFQFMDQSTQQFIINLSNALAVAMGNATSNVLTVTHDKTLSYIAFVMNSIEFCILTKDNYLELQGATG